MDTETGLFTVKDSISTPKLFLGSVDPEAKVKLYGEEVSMERVDRLVRGEIVFANIIEGLLRFYPDFLMGYRPFGIESCEPRDIEHVGMNGPVFSSEFREKLDTPSQKIKVELGSRIIRICRQLQDSERGYLVVRS